MWKRLLLSSSLFSLSTTHCSDPNSFIKDLPEYTWEEVSKHKTLEDSVWLVVGKGVYDVTSFIESHPGGNKILLAAGKSADPYWNLYRIHHQDKVHQILESLRIGNLKSGEKVSELKDPYTADPARDKLLVKHSEKPFNAETPSDLLTDDIITPNSKFFIRNHLPVPVIDPDTYELEVVYEGDKCAKFSLNDLKTKFEVVEVESAIQCAGNRRYESNSIGSTRGVEWRVGAIGNAVWKGIRVLDLLSYFGETSPLYKHLQVEAFDTDPSGPFGTSIPIEKALDPDTILAFEMNGEPIPRDHGFPLRLIVPGYVGVRNVKWVKRITASAQESQLIWHTRDYRLFSINDELSNVQFESRLPIYEVPVQSIISSPLDGSSFNKHQDVLFKGLGYSGGGKDIARVEITLDKGENWIETNLTKRKKAFNRQWGWSLWEVTVPGSEIKEEVCVRAIDTSGNTQPESLKSVWNYRGILNNSWHCIKILPKN